MNIIPQSDVFRLIARSKLPTAQQFESWVFDGVLPQIFKTGGYIPVTAEDDDLTIVCKALKIQQRTIEQKDALIASQKASLASHEASIKDQQTGES